MVDDSGADVSTEPGQRLGRSIANGDQLFVYGTLQFPEVLVELVGRCPELVAAELTGWRVAALPGRVYPGLVPAVGGVARGAVLSGLDAREWAVLDAFEDHEYELRRVRLGSAMSAWTYVWTSVVAQDDWYAEHFAAEHLSAFVARCAEWRRLL
ncbi:gamma-glutamylcyclotransferase family protein [Nocardia pseudovaccinii]|uniref:gamma-glutamylcyclotransferase family protein n=1 Tax=Nocardia pseudovaccinii TaxID=189540 RepID=UPI000A0675ED|nr:gamma-glutamylcyclotransferase family protein [Nocardia pseudovaccinii]